MGEIIRASGAEHGHGLKAFIPRVSGGAERLRN